MFRYLLTFVALCTMAAVAVLLAPGAYAETDALSANGVIHTIDLKAKTLTVKKADNTTVSVNFNKDTLITRNGKTVRVKALALQDAIKVRYRASGLALKLNATGPKTGKVAGTLSEALKGTGAVTIGTTVVNTTAQTRISRNGKIVSLSQLTRQDTVVAHTTPGVLNAPLAEPEAEDLIASGPEDDKVHGNITAISGSQVTIAPTNGTADVIVNVTGITMIEIDGVAAASGDLLVGMRVEVHFDPTTFDVFVIEADSAGGADDAHVTGTVGAVDLSAGTVTIAPANITVTVNAGTEIEVNGATGTLEDLELDMPIRAEYDITTMVAKEINAGAGDENNEDTNIEGTVASVDELNGTVTITPNGGGADVTINVVTDTDIEVNGVNASIASIQATMPVKAEYDQATMNAYEIHAGTDDGGGGGSEQDQVEGTVAAVDTGSSTITITPAGGGSDVTLTVTGTTEIEVNGDPGALGDISVGFDVKAKYVTATLEATELKADAPSANAK